MAKLNQQGFTLIEILIYTVIFAIVGGMLTGILINATRVEQRESASSEVTSQLNFVMQTIGRLVRASSNIEIEAGVATSTLKLRMRDSAKDPTYISLSNNAIQLKEGSSATTTLTSDKVVVNTLSFKKFTQYPGHDTVSIDLTLTYNTQNTAGQVERSLSSAIARVSAATFDADVLPGGTYNYNLGQTGSPWQKIIMADGSAANPSYTFGSDTGLGIFRAGSNALGFTSGGTERMRISGAAIGIGTTTPNNALVVAGNGRLTVTHANEPSLLLQIDGTSKAMIGVGPGIITGIGNNDLGIRSDGSSITLGIGNQRQITLNTSSTFPLVGIGTTAPSSTLDISGGAGTNAILTLGNSAGTSYSQIYQDVANTDSLFINNHRSGPSSKIYFQTNSVTGMTLDNSGNVGIRTTGPNYLLETNGMANAGGLLAEMINIRSNLLSNGGMEGTYSGGIAPSWSQLGTEGTFAAETTDVHSGSESQKITAGITYGKVKQYVSLTAGNWYTVSAWVKPSSVDVNSVYMRLKNTADTIIYWTVYPSGTGWQRLTKTFQASATENALFHIGTESTNAIVYFDDVSFANYNATNVATGGSALAVTVDGNVGIGTTYSNIRFFVKGSTADATAYGIDVADSALGDTFWVRNDGEVYLKGNVGINATTQHSTNARIYINYTGGGVLYGMNFRPGSDTTHVMDFENAAGSVVGSISETATNIAFNTSSDERLKENIKNLDNVGSVIDALSPRRFKWISTGTDGVGFIAQELYNVIPEAVTVGSPAGVASTAPGFKPWAVDFSKIVPYLVAEIKDLRNQVNLLQSSITATSTLQASQGTIN